MTRGPEDPLARMARWDALRRRLDDAVPTGDPPPPAATDGDPAPVPPGGDSVPAPPDGDPVPAPPAGGDPAGNARYPVGDPGYSVDDPGYRVEDPGFRLDDPGPADGRPANALNALNDLAAAARRVVERHPAASVTVTIQDPAGTSSVRVSRTGDQLTVTATDARPAPRSEPAASGHHREEDRTGSQAIAELAELLRQNPSLLSQRD